MRLSDLHLRYTGKAPKTWLDSYDQSLHKLKEKEDSFRKEEDELRKQSVERGRKQVPQLVRKCLCPEFRSLTYDPYDIKAIMHPVDFIVFDGMNAKDMKSVTLLSRKPSDEAQSTILASIGKAIGENKYDWKIARITLNGKVSIE
jgi:predicted Holliday junction resolvase-like endonuclease